MGRERKCIASVHPSSLEDRGASPIVSLALNSPAHSDCSRAFWTESLPLQELKDIQARLATLASKSELEQWAIKVEASLKGEVEVKNSQFSANKAKLTYIDSTHMAHDCLISDLETAILSMFMGGLSISSCGLQTGKYRRIP